MAKSSSPVRLDAVLMEEATRDGYISHRSAAQTIEYWANLGKRVGKIIDPSVLLELQAGTVEIEIKTKNVSRIDAEDVFAQIEEQRAEGTLNSFVPRDKPIYQASATHPGLLEQILPDGTIRYGRFRSGEFKPEKV